ncbi:hypothetical protein, partial [Blastomonas sp. CCH1-A6]|uniref:hypothetical protein n=1 Tax=Blastomonas sp. CCH1-A6 TaxID=1768762 RepID=UPI001E33AFEE
RGRGFELGPVAPHLGAQLQDDGIDLGHQLGAPKPCAALNRRSASIFSGLGPVVLVSACMAFHPASSAVYSHHVRSAGFTCIAAQLA